MEAQPRKGVTLVTGATSGIGRASALGLARDGWTVIVHGRNAQRGAEVVAQIETSGGTARFLEADLNDLDAVRTLATDAGEVDVLVNNAGSSWFGPSSDLGVNAYDQLFNANVRSAYYLVAGLAPSMAERGRGSIINLGSMVGEIGLSGSAAYGATKAALSSMTRSWAAEFSPHGVRVNAIAAGPVYSTPDKTPRIDQLAPTTMLRRGAQVEEIAEVVVFLASSASSYITGATLAVDGGRTAA